MFSKKVGAALVLDRVSRAVFALKLLHTVDGGGPGDSMQRPPSAGSSTSSYQFSDVDGAGGNVIVVVAAAASVAAAAVGRLVKQPAALLKKSRWT